MLNAAIVGLGRWGQHLVDSVHRKSDLIRFVAGATRSVATAAGYAREKGFRLYDSYNTVRPHQALGYRTPHEFLQDLARVGYPQGVTHVLDEYSCLTRASRPN